MFAIADSGYRFSFYLSANVYLTSNPEYMFRTTQNHRFVAVFTSEDKHQIVFLDANNKYLGSILVEPNTILSSEDVERFTAMIPNRPGYQFDLWSIDFPTIITQPLTVIKANYISNIQHESIVKVYVEEGVYKTANVKYGKKVTVSAPEIDGKKFLHWSIRNAIVSYNQTLTINVFHDMDIEAMYIDDDLEEVLERVPVTYLNDNVITDGSKIYFLASSNIIEGYEIIEQGLIFLNTSENYSDYIDLKTDEAHRVQALRLSINNEFAVLKDTIDDHFLHVRSYLVVKDLEGNFHDIY